MPKISKGVFKKAFHKPNARTTSKYSVVEDLSQNPYAMLALEVLQSCLDRRDALLKAIGSMDSSILLVKFNISDVNIRLP